MLLLVKGNSSGQFCPYSSNKKKNKKNQTEQNSYPSIAEGNKNLGI